MQLHNIHSHLQLPILQGVTYSSMLNSNLFKLHLVIGPARKMDVSTHISVPMAKKMMVFVYVVRRSVEEGKLEQTFHKGAGLYI